MIAPVCPSRSVQLAKRPPPFDFVTLAGVLKHPGLWNHMAMKGHRILRLVCAWLVAAGLVVAPFVVPAAALTNPDPAMSSMMADMPCCPDESEKQSPQPDKCKDCPAMFLCASGSAQGVVLAGENPSHASAVFAELVPGLAAHLNDIGSSPPAPPPRS
jgi:hypothetical protein